MHSHSPLDSETDETGYKKMKTLFVACITISNVAARKEDERAAVIVALPGKKAIDLHESLPLSEETE